MWVVGQVVLGFLLGRCVGGLCVARAVWGLGVWFWLFSGGWGVAVVLVSRYARFGCLFACLVLSGVRCWCVGVGVVVFVAVPHFYLVGGFVVVCS